MTQTATAKNLRGPPAPAQATRERLGFRDGERGIHSSRTMMLGDLSQLLDHAAPRMSVADYRRLVVEENVLGKPTRMTREHTVRKLKAMYGLEPTIPREAFMSTPAWPDAAIVCRPPPSHGATP